MLTHHNPPTPPAAIVTAGGVFLPAHLAEPVWRVLRNHLVRQQRDGGRVRPEVAHLVELLRAAAYAHLTARGHAPGTFTDMPAASAAKRLLTTSDLAARLGVTERHARRIAQANGVQPITRNCWDRADVAALAARRGAS